MVPILITVDLEDRNLCLIDFPIPKTVGLAGLTGLVGLAGLVGLQNLLLQTAEGFADFGGNSRFHLQNSENEATLLALLR